MNNKRRCGSLILSLCAILCVLSACAPSAQAPTPAVITLSPTVTRTSAPGEVPLWQWHETPEEIAMTMPDLRVPCYVPPEFDPKLNPEVDAGLRTWFPMAPYTIENPEWYEIEYETKKGGQDSNLHLGLRVLGWTGVAESDEFYDKENYVRVDLDGGFTFYEQKTTLEAGSLHDVMIVCFLDGIVYQLYSFIRGDNPGMYDTQMEEALYAMLDDLRNTQPYGPSGASIFPWRWYSSPEELAKAMPNARVPAYVPPEFNPKLNPESDDYLDYPVWFPEDVWAPAVDVLGEKQEHYVLRYDIPYPRSAPNSRLRMEIQGSGEPSFADEDEKAGYMEQLLDIGFVEEVLDDGFTVYVKRVTDEREHYLTVVCFLDGIEYVLRSFVWGDSPSAHDTLVEESLMAMVDALRNTQPYGMEP